MCSIASSFLVPQKGSDSTFDISERSTEKSKSSSLMHIGEVANSGSGVKWFLTACFWSNYLKASGSPEASQFIYCLINSSLTSI